MSVCCESCVCVRGGPIARLAELHRMYNVCLCVCVCVCVCVSASLSVIRCNDDSQPTTSKYKEVTLERKRFNIYHSDCKVIRKNTNVFFQRDIIFRFFIIHSEESKYFKGLHFIHL
jgi:hypothetical protein